MVHTVQIGKVRIGGRQPLALIAGPCVIESRRACLDLAHRLAELAAAEGIPFVFKASYDKANRTAAESFRGPGLDEGLEILAEVRERCAVPVLTDVHREEDVARVAAVADVLQVPAFLCRQTDLILAVGATGKPVNVKKGQFLAPADVQYIISKVERSGNRRIMITERGTTFGYHILVVDMRSLPWMRGFGYPVVFDATHSVQLPGGAGHQSGGDRRWVPFLARAAVAAGCDAVFLETYVRPEKARSDGANALPLAGLSALWRTLRQLDEIVR